MREIHGRADGIESQTTFNDDRIYMAPGVAQSGGIILKDDKNL